MKKIFCAILFILCGCTLARVDVEVLSERTTLENQILGTYNALDTEMLLVASVRGVDSAGNVQAPAKRSQEQMDAIEAMQVLDFHSDDIQTFKRLGWIGENSDGLLHAFGVDTVDVPENLKEFTARYTSKEFDSVVSEANRSREIIMQRVLDMNENLSPGDMPQIRRIFGKLNREAAFPGERVQLDDGRWSVKKE